MKYFYSCRVDDSGVIVSEYFFPHGYDYECFKDLVRTYEGKVVTVGREFHNCKVWYAEVEEDEV